MDTGHMSQVNVCNIANSSIANSTCTREIPQGLGYGLVFVLGFLVNGAALRALIVKRRSWTDTHIYMFNLAIADSTLVVFLPFRVFDAFICLPKTDLCTFLISIHYINMYASIMTAMAISVHRYLLIRFPMQARSCRKKKQTALAVCLVIWGFLVITCAIFNKDNSPAKLWTCFERCKNIPLSPEFISSMVFAGFIAPLLIVVFCSSQIISILSKVDEMTMERKRTINIVKANLIVFIVCYTPIHIAFPLNWFYPPPEGDWRPIYLPTHMYLLVSEWIASTNCCFDAIGYYFLLVHFYS